MAEQDPLDSDIAEELADEAAEIASGEPEAEVEVDAAAAQVEVDLDLARTAAERDEYLGALQRLQADFENYKKRMIRQQTELLDRAAEDLVNKLLPVLDAVDLARQHGQAEAVDPVANALSDVLAKEGLERIDPVGSAFDPNEHEAVAHEEADEAGAEPSVSELMRAGYRWRGKLLRPAMVKVKG
jgi:molecular chaperone GrpE